jgi:uracil-DNA glycosylase family 4
VCKVTNELAQVVRDDFAPPAALAHSPTINREAKLTSLTSNGTASAFGELRDSASSGAPLGTGIANECAHALPVTLGFTRVGTALDDANILRDQVFVTNAVKHFKWEPRGKRRLHSKPNAAEVHACNGWLEAEIRLVRPRVIVCLGATAAQAFLGRKFRLTEHRGEALDGAPWAPYIVATLHPSALLRMMSDREAYEEEKDAFVRDLEAARSLVTFRRTRGRIATALKHARPHP